MHEFDATQLKCPLPLVHTKRKLKAMAPGERLRVITIDKSSVIDFKVYAETSGNRLVEYQEAEGKFIFILEKSS